MFSWPIDGTLTSSTTSDMSEPGSNVNEGIFFIPQSTLPDDLVSHSSHSWGRSYLSAVVMSVHSTTSADRMGLNVSGTNKK